MKPFKIKLVFDRKKTANTTNKRGVIEVYIYDANTKKKVYLSTGIEVLSTQFAQSKGERGRIVKHPNQLSINGELERFYREIEAFVYSDKCNSVEDIKTRDNTPENSQSVLTFIEQELKRRNPSYQTLVQHQTLIKRLIQFGKIKTFNDLTYENIVAFDDFLKTEGEGREALGSVTAYKRHSMLNTHIKEAVNRGLCSYNPYGTFKPKKGKSKDPVFLDEIELQALINYDLSDKVDSERLLKIRDIFVFQCFTGLAYADLKKFNKNDIFEIDGSKVIKSNRQKTEQSYITVLLPDAINILEKYDYDLPVISNQKYNDYLKLLGMYITDDNGNQLITKRLTTHVARHTCGTYLLNKGVPLETVARVLGHSNTNMTRHYARLLGKKVVSDVLTHVLGNKPE